MISAGSIRSLSRARCAGSRCTPSFSQARRPQKKCAPPSPIGIILTGGPFSVYAEDAPKADPAIFDLGIPVLGICYGMQMMCAALGGEVSPCEVSEYGTTEVTAVRPCVLF